MISVMTILIAIWLTKEIPETDLKTGVSYSYSNIQGL